MLTIFVLPCPFRDASRLIETMPKDIVSSVIEVKHVALVNKWLDDRLTISPWYGVFYANEWFERPLSDAIINNLVYSERDMLVLWQLVDKHGYAQYNPRIFKSYLRLDPDKDHILPYNDKILTYDTILDGWLRFV
jgi:hypothetical protein